MNNLLNFKSFLKFLSKNKSYTFIDVFGLSVSLMFVILIGIYTKQELSTDRFHENGNRIYALCDGRSFGTAYRLAYRIQEQCPEIEKVCPMVTGYEQQSVEIADTKLNADLLMVDSTFFDLFSFELPIGDRKNAFAARSYAVISETFAHKAFPGDDAMGKSIRLNDSVNVTVNGIIKDIKNSVVPYADIILRVDNVKYFNWSMDSETFNNAGSANIFVMTTPGSDIHAKEEFLAEYFKKIFWVYEMGMADKVLFIPLKEVYFSEFGAGFTSTRTGDWKFVIILLSIGVLILIFAIINYINLTVAQTGFRAKEMATRRLMGSSRMELFSRLMLESTMLTLFSFLSGLLLARLAVPFANDLFETKIYMSEIFTLPGMILSVILILLIGGLAGLLPAIVISNSKPIDVVRGGFRQKTKMVFSKFFITFQNMITIALIAASIVMVYQINHMINAPLGYNTSNVLSLSTFQFEGKEQLTSFVNEARQIAGIKEIGFGQGTPFTRGNNNTTIVDDINVSFQILTGDSAFFNIFDFHILQDNRLANPDGFYVNEETFRFLGIPEDTPVIKAKGGWEINVAGIIRNFKLRNVLGNMETVLFKFAKIENMYPWNIVFEIEGDHKETFGRLSALYQNMTGLTDFPAEFIDQQITDSFAAQRRTSRIVIVFSCVAILISLLGLLAMSTYFIQQRSREVAVRKVFGSSNEQILTKLVFTFLNYVLIAFVLVCPFIWYFMKRWLSDYDYRITLTPLIFIVAGIFCLFISFITVFWQSFKAANSNPANSIKAE